MTRGVTRQTAAQPERKSPQGIFSGAARLSGFSEKVFWQKRNNE